ncbi:MAG TPA: hypothetical protein VFY43_00570 [Candidatus Limnocylindria bacterium]|nr:hypothetical protein [Candidatus Limnocylindria bacterium]
MDVIAFRLIHILGGIFWVGSALTFFYFVQPSVAATAPGSQRFLLHLVRTRRLSDVTLAAAILNVAAGLILIWRDSNGFQLDWLLGPGLGFTIGASAAVLALILFSSIGYPNTRKLVAIGSMLAAEERPPTQAEAATMASAQRALAPLAIWVPILLIVAAACMATARYWPLLYQ